MKLHSISMMTMVVFFLLSCGNSGKIYRSEDLKASRNTVKTIAIIPFSVALDTRQAKDITPEILKGAEEKTGFDIQNSIYSWFLQQKRIYIVDFQDVDKTNTILRNAGVTYESMGTKGKGELCKLLNVDAVISGKAVLSQPLSEAGAVAVAFFLHKRKGAHKGDATLNLHDEQGNLLWKYDDAVNGGVSSSSQSIINRLMERAAADFPFKKTHKDKKAERRN